MAIKEDILVKSDSLLKIEIDNYWTAIDFSNLFDSITRLYSYNYLLVIALESLKAMDKEYNWGKKYKQFPKFMEVSFNFKHNAFHILKNPDIEENMSGIFLLNVVPIFPLQVRRITFGSKGSVDLLGIGKIFEVIKDLVVNYVPNKSQKLDDIIKEKEIEEHEQKILQMKIQNLKNLGLNSEEILSIIGFEADNANNIKELIRNEKINNLKIEDHSGN